MSKQGNTSKTGLVATGALVATLLGMLAWASMVARPWALGSGLLTSKDQLERAGTHLEKGALKKARGEILVGAAAAERARRAYGGPTPLLDVARLSPSAEGAIGELDHLVGAAGHLSDAAVGTLEVALRSLRGREKIVANAPGGGSQIRLERIEELAGVVGDIRASLDSARRELKSVNAHDLPDRLRPGILSGIRRAEETDEVLARTQEGLDLLPRILGANGPRNYLIGMQNSAELRGPGGAMLRFSILRFRDGRPELVPNRSVYKLDINRQRVDIPIPEDAWYVRGIEDAQRFGNANWSPDWPSSAQLTLAYAHASEKRLPEQDRLPRIDGFIAVDPVVMENLMPGVGTFRMEGGKKISTKKVLPFLLYKAYAQFPNPGIRRAILRLVVDEFYENLLEPDHPTLLLEGLSKSLVQKNMQIWMARDEEQRFVRSMDWDGGIERSKGDYLYVVEQNVGGNKLNYFERQTHTMDVTISGDDARVVTEIAVENPVPIPAPGYVLGNTGPRHLPMLNVYVRPSAKLLGTSVEGERNDLGAQGLSAWDNGRPAEHVERGKRIWSATLDIPAGRTGAVRYSYLVPGVVGDEGARRVYRLKIQHQPLLNPADLKVTVHLPREARALQAKGWERRGNDVVYARELKEDKELEVSWRE